MFKKITLLTTLCLLIAGQTKAQYCADNPDNSSPFDWTASGWWLYIKPNDNSPGQYQYIASPYHPNTGNTQPNTGEIEANPGLGDYNPSDGWVLVRQEMGLTETTSVVFPQFILYNRFESMLRYFVFLAGITEANDVEINVHFDYAQVGATHVSATLEHAFMPMDVVEGYTDKSIVIAIPNKGFFAHGVWAMADIPMAYDPCTCQFPSAMRISSRTSSYSSFVLNLEGGGDIKQVIGPPAAPITNNNRVKNEGQRFANVTGGINAGISKGVSAYRTAEALGSVARQLTLSKANKNLTPGIVGVLNGIPGFGNVGANGLTETQMYLLSQINSGSGASAEVTGAIGSLFKSPIPSTLVPDWLKTAVPFASTAFALLDFIIGGGKSTPPKPMHFNADFSFKGDGSISRSQPQTSSTFYIPGSRIIPNVTTEARRPVYDKTMGILNLVEQPVMMMTSGTTPVLTSEGISNYIHSSSLLLSQTLKYALNPASGLQLADIRAALYFPITNQWNTHPDGVLVTPHSVGLIEEEPGIWRTPYMPLSCLSSYSIKFPLMESFPPVTYTPNCIICGDIQLHLVAKLTSPAGGETAWAARYRVNTAPAPYTYENTPPNPYLNVQETVQVPSIQDIINGNIQSWNPVVVTNDIVVTRGEVENYLNSINAVRDHQDVLVQQFVRGQVIKAPVKFDLAPNCGSNPPVDAAWLSNFCNNSNRYNPILALRTPSEEEEAPVAEHHLNLSIAPNPTGDATLLKYNLLEAGPVSIVLSDYTGRRLAELHTASEQAAGEYQLLIPLDRYAPGIYVVTVARPSGKDSLRVVKH